MFMKSVTIKLDTITAPMVIQPEIQCRISGMPWQRGWLNGQLAAHH
jgi:hypothetical protein